MRKQARVDSNHREVKDVLETCGWLVLSLAPLGNGVPDLLAYRPSNGRWALVEVKTPKGKLRTAQNVFIALGWPVQIVRSMEEATRL